MSAKKTTTRGNYSILTVSYDVARVNHNTANVVVKYKWKFTNGVSRGNKPDGNVRKFPYWVGWGCSINKRKSYDRVIGRYNKATTYAEMLNGSHYADVGWDKHDHSYIYEGYDSGWTTVFDSTKSISIDTSEIKVDVGLLRPSSGSETNDEDQVWFHCGVNIDASIATYKRPSVRGLSLSRSGNTLNLSWNAATLDKAHGATSATYAVTVNYKLKSGSQSQSYSASGTSVSASIPSDIVKHAFTATFTVVATDNNGVSGNPADSNEVSGADYKRPSVSGPSLSRSGNTLNLSWNAATLDKAHGATSATYAVTVNYELKSGTQSQSYSATGTSLSVPLLEAAKNDFSATFTVVATDNNGVSSNPADSNEVAHVYQPPSTPSVYAGYNPATDMLSISWSSSSLDEFASYASYSVYFDGRYLTSTSGNGTSLNCILEPKSSHYATVYCYDGIGESGGGYDSFTVPCGNAWDYDSKWTLGDVYVYNGHNWALSRVMFAYDGKNWKPQR